MPLENKKHRLCLASVSVMVMARVNTAQQLLQSHLCHYAYKTHTTFQAINNAIKSNFAAF